MTKMVREIVSLAVVLLLFALRLVERSALPALRPRRRERAYVRLYRHVPALPVRDATAS